MKRFGLIGLIALLAICAAAPAFAWEFSMKGDWEWRYRYWTRTGQNDIFGQMDGTNVNLGTKPPVRFPNRSDYQPNERHKQFRSIGRTKQFWLRHEPHRQQGHYFPKDQGQQSHFC